MPHSASPLPPPRDPVCPFVNKCVSPIHTTYQSGILGQGGNRANKAENAEKLLSVYEKEDFRLFSKHQLYKCKNSFCCKTGSEVSKCVYLASMAVKIEHAIAGHSHDILQQCIFDVHASRIMGLQLELKMPKYMLLSIETYMHKRKIE